MIKLEIPLKRGPSHIYLKDLFLVMFWFKWSLVKLETCVKKCHIQLAKIFSGNVHSELHRFFMQSVSSGLEMKIDR